MTPLPVQSLSPHTPGMNISAQGENTARGILAIVLAVFFFSAADTLAKWLGHQGYPPVQIVFCRYLFGLIPAAILVKKFGIDALHTQHPYQHALRAFLIFSALFFYFWGLKLMPIAEAIAVAFTAPLFITVLSVPLLREHVGIRRWCAVGIGFIGALIVLQPGTEAFKPEALLIVTSAFLFSLAMILTRRMSRTETNVSMFTYTTTGAGLISAMFVGAAWEPLQTEHIVHFVILGFTGGTAAYLIIIAFRNASAAVIAPYEYTALIWTSLSGWIIWNEKPGLAVWIGASVIIASSLYITRRETAKDDQA